MANPQLETFLKQVKDDPALLQRVSDLEAAGLAVLAALSDGSTTWAKP